MFSGIPDAALCKIWELAMLNLVTVKFTPNHFNVSHHVI